VDGMNESTAIKEARRLGIPTFGIVDSNTDPTPIDFPIPANDDSLKSIHFIVNHIADVIIEARGGVVENRAENYDSEMEGIKAELLSRKSGDTDISGVELNSDDLNLSDEETEVEQTFDRED